MAVVAVDVRTAGLVRPRPPSAPYRPGRGRYGGTCNISGPGGSTPRA
ncbi:hypothetical protein APS67_005697 [Streptomyces sp. AVP053U2]|nr:hypothetical protein APS67_005697 [Streptomyces sp. AVP053U2]